MMLFCDTKVVKPFGNLKLEAFLTLTITKRPKPNIMTIESYYIAVDFYLVKDSNIKLKFYGVHGNPKYDPTIENIGDFKIDERF